MNLCTLYTLYHEEPPPLPGRGCKPHHRYKHQVTSSNYRRKSHDTNAWIWIRRCSYDSLLHNASYCQRMGFCVTNSKSPQVVIDAIVEMWNRGCSASVIAITLRTTRNAVIGHVGRMRMRGIELRRGELKPRAKKVRKVKLQPSKPAIDVTPKLLLKTPLPRIVKVIPKLRQVKDQWVSFHKTKDNCCRYIDNGLYCNQPAHRASFCDEHYHKCYMRVSVRPNIPQTLVPWMNPSQSSKEDH